jgi:pimeloyl-ACP methyl ester carboxylesterase
VSTPPPQSLYLDGAPEPVFVTFHRAPEDVVRDTAVILCPPFGLDEVCSYRSLREWAGRLAAAGYPSLRLSFPGTGDSGGSPRDPGRLEAWTAAAGASASWIQAASGARRVVAIGIGLGGMVAYAAAAAGAPVHDLVLWGTPARGRGVVRELRAFSKLETSQFFEGLEHPPPLAPGELEAGGFLLSGETVQALGALDLRALTLPVASSRRLLLLERDGMAVDAGLREHLESSGARITVAAGKGYGAMTSHPQSARPPLELIERVTAWLDEAASPGAPGGQSRPWTLPDGAGAGAEIQVDETTWVKETPLAVRQPFGNLAGILAEPLGHREPGLCAVLLNAGAVRHIGPNRMWVEAARRWAARGIPSLRVDVEGIGDADGATTPYVKNASLLTDELIAQALATLDVLQEREVGDRFLLAGLCAGAYWSFEGALRDARVSAAVMVNPVRLSAADSSLLAARDLRALRSNLTAWSKMRREASRERVAAMALWMLSAPKRSLARLVLGERNGSAAGDEVEEAFDRLEASGKRVMLLFAHNEALGRELTESGHIARLAQRGNVWLESVAVRDHTCRPIWAQREVHAALDRALARELEADRLAASQSRQAP